MASNTKEYLITPPGKFSLRLQEIWEYRELFYFFTWRDIKVKYKQTLLGFLWAILQPLAMMILLTIVFGNALKVESDGIPYPIFVFSGLLLWDIFSNGLTNASQSMVTNAEMIKKIYFPRMIIPMSSVLVALFDFCMALLIYFALLLYFDHPVNWFRVVVFLPFSLLITVVTTFGAGCLLAALNVKYRDFRYIIPYMIRFLLFVNPIMYSTSIFKSEWAQYLIALNPLAGAINMSRYAFVDGAVRWDLVGVSCLGAVLLLIVGVYVFRKTEGYFADLA